MSRRKHILGFGLLLGAATAVPAYAQPTQLPTAQSMATDFPACTKKATDAEQEQAKQKFIAARQDSEESNHDSAIKRYKLAYDLDCSKPELLIMIANSFEKKSEPGSKQAALAALEVYTQRAPKDAPDYATTLTRIENMKKAINSSPPPTASSSNGGKTEEPQGEHSIVPWLVVGAGGVAIVTGLVLSLFPYPDGCDPDSTSKEGKEGVCTGPNATENQSTAGTVKGMHTAGPIVMIGGGVLVAGGLIWHFLEPTGPKSTTGKIRRNITPTFAPGYGGLSYGGTF